MPVGLVAALVAWLEPALARACPVCFSATEANRDAYLGGTIFLSLLPLALLGGLALLIRYRARAVDAAAQTEASLPERPSTVG